MLSSELLSDFSKIVVNKNENKKETTSYGSIVKIDDGSEEGSTYVKIDGSDILTPIRKENGNTSFLSDKDRVILMIKNHDVIITGNLTNPSVNKEELKGTSFSDIYPEEYGMITSALNSITNIINRINSLESQLSAQLQSINDDIDDIKTDINSLETWKESIDSEIVSIKDRLDKLEKK